jgi:hypothetical protein
VSPATTDADADSAPVHRQFPDVAASQIDQWLYVSVAATFVHSAVAEVAIEPLDAADQASDWRVVSDAAFAVPSSPGSPVCNAMYAVVTANDWLRIVSSNLFSA